MKYHTLVIGHRGAKGLVKYENTINSFQKAIDVGADAIELDIRMTSDKVLIVHHDPNINNLIIKDNKFDVIKLKAEEIGFSIPTLEETLIYCKNKIYLDIELKEVGYEISVLNLILSYFNYSDFGIRSFNDKSIKIIKKYDKNVRTGLLLGVGKAKFGIFTRVSELFPLFRILNCRCDFVTPYYKLMILGFNFRMKILGKPVIAWTVNDERVMKKLLRKSIYGIITDYPDKLIRLQTQK